MDQALVDPVGGGAVAAQPGLVAASGSGGSSGAAQSTHPARRTCGRWRRIPRATGCTPVTQLPAGGGEVRKTSSDPSILHGQTELAEQTPGAMWLMKGLKELEEVRRFAPSLTRRRLELTPLQPEEVRMTIDQWKRDMPKTTDVVVTPKGSRELAESRERANQEMLEDARRLEEADEDLCDTEEAKVAFRAFKAKFAAFYRKLATTKPEDVVFKHKPPSDTLEEHLTAEEIEIQANLSGWRVCPQAQQFSSLALKQYNSTNKMQRFEMAKVLLSKCFTEADGRTFAHVNFTATSHQSTSHSVKRLFFAELMLIPGLQAYEDFEPMCGVHVCTIDDSCFGGCHEMVRDIKEPLSNDMDYDRCHACSERIKHPRGARFMGGHNRTRMPYVSTFAWTYKSQ